MPTNTSWSSGYPVSDAIAQSQPSTGAPSSSAAADASVDFPVPGGPVSTTSRAPPVTAPVSQRVGPLRVAGIGRG